MNFTVQNFSFTDILNTDDHHTCVVVGIYADGSLSSSAQSLNNQLSDFIQTTLHRGDIQGNEGDTLLLYPNNCAARVLLVGLGTPDSLNTNKLSTIHATVAKQLQKTNVKHVYSCLNDASLSSHTTLEWKVQCETQNVGNALYTFTVHKPSASAVRTPLESWTIRGDSALSSAIATGYAVHQGMSLCKDLGNQPGNVAIPTYLAEQAVALASMYPNIKTTIIDQNELEAMGAGAFVSVAKGSVNEGKLIIMEYMQGEHGTAPVALVGKGITFDSGGISLKPGANMDEMKYDMGGAASVFGTMKAIAEVGAPINLICAIASAENMPAGNASKPGDIVTTLSGQTVEILNTDAEGRLVLCDTLTYVERYNPSVVIDIATLTGAVIVALGNVASGMMANDDELAKALTQTSKETGDLIWQLPIWDEYQPSLDSNFADMQNIGGREAGSITAACFLARFAKKFKWAHLDIAGTAWNSGAQKGATGRPVPLLTQYLLNNHCNT